MEKWEYLLSQKSRLVDFYCKLSRYHYTDAAYFSELQNLSPEEQQIGHFMHAFFKETNKRELSAAGNTPVKLPAGNQSSRKIETSNKKQPYVLTNAAENKLLQKQSKKIKKQYNEKRSEGKKAEVENKTDG